MLTLLFSAVFIAIALPAWGDTIVASSIKIESVDDHHLRFSIPHASQLIDTQKEWPLQVPVIICPFEPTKQGPACSKEAGGSIKFLPDAGYLVGVMVLANPLPTEAIWHIEIALNATQVALDNDFFTPSQENYVHFILWINSNEHGRPYRIYKLIDAPSQLPTI